MNLWGLGVKVSGVETDLAWDFKLRCGDEGFGVSQVSASLGD